MTNPLSSRCAAVLFPLLQLGLLSCAGSRLVVEDVDRAALDVVTWNVNYGLGGADAVGVLADFDVDVVLLQEVTPEVERAIRASPVLAGRFAHHRFHSSDGPGGLAVLSRFAIVDDELLPAVTWFPAWHGTVQTPLGAVQLLNVHLRPPFDDNGSVLSGVVVTPAMRSQEMSTFAAMLDDDVATVVAGDFNEGSGGAIDVLTARGMVSALDVADDDTPTWRWQGVPFRLRMDHVFVDDDFAVTAARVVEKGQSDHLPVVVRLQQSQAAHVQEPGSVQVGRGARAAKAAMVVAPRTTSARASGSPPR